MAASCVRASALLLLVAVSGCAPAPAGRCPNDLPEACPSSAPGYSSVTPIVQKWCLGCHVGGGLASAVPLDTYVGLYARREDVLHQVFACKMPPNGREGPTDGERATLLAWLLCNAPP